MYNNCVPSLFVRSKHERVVVNPHSNATSTHAPKTTIESNEKTNMAAVELSALPIEDLNKWQRMRLATLAVAAGGDLDDAITGTPAAANQVNPPVAAVRCQLCRDAVAARRVVRFAFADAGRSLVDKSYDALAQSMSSLGLDDDWAVTAADGGGLAMHLPAAAGNTCFLCALGAACNSRHRIPCGAVGDASTAGGDGESSSASRAPWWWCDRYDAAYCNTETGDIGPSDHVEELVARPLSSWAENCRYYLAATARRCADQQQAAPSGDGGGGDAGLAAVAEAMACATRIVRVVVGADDDGASAQLASASADVAVSLEDAPPNVAGFNRTRVHLTRAFTTAVACPATTVLDTPLSYARFLASSMMSIADGLASLAVGAAATGSDCQPQQQLQSRARLAGALVCGCFSDARRRQAQPQQFQHLAAGAGGDGGVMSAMFGGGGGGTAAILAQMQEQQATAAASAPAPPFLLPLSFFEEMLILLPPALPKTADAGCGASASIAAVVSAVRELRGRVELAPEPLDDDADGDEAEQDERRWRPKPSYASEFAAAMVALARAEA